MQKKKTYRQMNTAVILSETQQASLQAQAFDTDAVVELFLQQQDCKESSRALYRRTLRQFFAWVRRTGRMLNAMNRADILQYRDGIISGAAMEDGKGRSPLTAAAYLTAVKLFYTWLESVGAYPNIAASVKMPERANKFRREPLNNAQAAALCENAAQGGNLRDNAIVNLLLRTGMRTIEVVRANVEDLKTKAGTHVLYVQGKGKQDKSNFVILSPKCYTALQAYLATRTDTTPTAPLFTCDSNNNKGGRMTTRTISHIAKEHLQAIGLDSREYTAHSLRHTFGCSMLEETGDLHATQLAMRHANPGTTEIYTYHIDEMRRLRAAAENRLDNLF